MATYDMDGCRAKLDELVERASLGEKIVVSGGSGNVVMVSEEDWDDMVEALSRLMTPEMLERIKTSFSEYGEPVPAE